jgi:hypothetical protein
MLRHAPRATIFAPIGARVAGACGRVGLGETDHSINHRLSATRVTRLSALAFVSPAQVRVSGQSCEF